MPMDNPVALSSEDFRIGPDLAFLILATETMEDDPKTVSYHSKLVVLGQ